MPHSWRDERTVRDQVVRDEMLSEENYSPISLNEGAYQLTKSSHYYCQLPVIDMICK